MHVSRHIALPCGGTALAVAPPVKGLPGTAA